MKCPNCGTDMFEEDTKCQKCGWNDEMKGKASGGLASFFKTAITKPWIPVGNTYGVRVPVTAMHIVIASTVLYIFIWLSSEFDGPSTSATSMPIIPFITFSVFLAIIFAIFLSSYMECIGLSLKEKEAGKQF